jgi:hypothetical protein
VNLEGFKQMRFYTQFPKQSLQAFPKAVRVPLERALDEILPTVQTAVLASVQRVGARAVDEAVEKLGLGRFGIRLTGSSMSPSAESWEALVLSWSPSSVAEAAEVVVRRALDSFFDQGAGEWFGIESMNIRWLRNTREAAEIPAGGSVVLNWSWLEREDFRRRVLENLDQGASQPLTLTGLDASSLAVVEIDLVLRAKARAQIQGQL